MFEDYENARRIAAWFDLSARGKVRVAGPDARSFLHNLCTNDIKNLQLGAGCEAFFATSQAKAVAYTVINCVEQDGEQSFLLDLDPGLSEKVVKHLDRFIISEQVELADCTAELAHLHVAGPEAERIVKQATGRAELPTRELQQTTDESVVGVRKHDLLASPGYDLFCKTGDRQEIIQRLQEAGAAPAGPEAFEVLRVEAGIPVYGRDIDDNRFVVEVGRTSQAISYTKGCYLGQEPIVMARDRGHVNRMLTGLRIGGLDVPASGSKLFRDGKEVGQVTSAVPSPRFGVIALAYVKRGNLQPGTVLEIDAAGSARTAEVGSLPFSSSGTK